MKRVPKGVLLLAGCAAGIGLVSTNSIAQEPAKSGVASTASVLQTPRTPLETPEFLVGITDTWQNVVSLRPKADTSFDFTPSDRLDTRDKDGFYQLGDITLRLRTGSNGAWQDFSSAKQRQPVRVLAAEPGTLSVADLALALPNCPLSVTRRWVVQGGKLALRFTLRNNGTEPVQIGALGIPMVFNNIITGRSLEEAHAKCSFSDPYIGGDAGYLQVTRLTGKGPALVVVPETNTPFEGYQLLNEPERPSQTFEGMFAWMVHTGAYAENEWKNAKPWNPPTTATLAPGESRTYGVRFLVADEIRDIEQTLAANKRPVAVGLPGYILPMDQDGKLFLDYGSKVQSIAVEPKNALTLTAGNPTKTGKASYTLRGKTWGRARVEITYADGTKQVIHYYITKPAAQAVSDLGNFSFTKQWFTDESDPFRRAPSVITYDREANQQVTQDSRVWIAGLGDEGGSGSWLAAGMKEFGQPNSAEVAKYEQFIDKVLWGNLQFKDGPNKYGVRKSVFFYEPAAVPGFTYDPKRNWTTWTSWNKQATDDIGRGYNYPHVVAAYWAMYRIARNHPGMVKSHDWNWYLDQAYQTTKFAFSRNEKGERRVGWAELGLMEGDVFLWLLEDLKREAQTAQAADVEALMKERADHWKTEAYPFGSEMAWDSTGQEEVYAWCRYFGYDDKALVSLNSILGYMPTLPHWGYNGNARRYWDFLYGGKLSRIERQLHHYGSGLNAIPVLTQYRSHPDDFYLLRVGYGGMMGALSNIDQEGFASVAFHSFPSTLKWDAYSGDYGPNFFGHALNTATYVIDHPDYGWQAFGGNVEIKNDWAQVTPKDSFRQRVYIAPRGLWLTLDAGTFAGVAVNIRTRAVRVELDGADSHTPQALLRIEQPGTVPGIGKYHPGKALRMERGGYVLPLQKSKTTVELTDTKP